MSLSCPQCGSKACKRNGYTRHGKQNHRCLDCGRQFSLEPTEVPTTKDDHKEYVGGFTSEGFTIEMVY